MRFLGNAGGRFLSPGQTQWAPTLTSHDPNPPITLESPPAAPAPFVGRAALFVNGQSQGQVGNLVGFAGSALLWASAAALLLATPQPQPQAVEMTFGHHAVAIAQANQSAQFFKSPRPLFVPVAGGPPSRPEYFVPGQDQPEQPRSFFNRPYPTPVVAGIPPRRLVQIGPQEQGPFEQQAPIFSGQTPLPAPAFKPWIVPPQESPEQTAPFLFGQQPLPSPAGRPIWTAGELQEGNQSATVWGGNADLFIAAAQFNVPPKPFSAAPQESPEQVQPLVFGQQPLPAPPSRPIVTARDEDQPSESAAFWGSEATRFIAGTQFSLPPTDSWNVEQPQPQDQGQPQFQRHFFAPDSVPVRQFIVGPQDSPEQTAPFLFGQQPLPSPVGKPIWTAGEFQEGSQSASIWGGNADLFIAATQFDIRPKTFAAAPQESTEQVQPAVTGQQPLPTPPGRPLVTAREADPPSESAQFWGSEATRFIAGTQFNLPAVGSRNVEQQRLQDQEQPQFQRYFFPPAVADSVVVRQFIVGPQESEEQSQPQFGRRFFAPVPIRSIAAGPQESLEQAQPWFARQYRVEADRPILRPLQAAPEASQEQVQPAFSRAYFAPIAAQIARPTLFAAPQESGEQEQPRFSRAYYEPVVVQAPPFRQFFVPEQIDAQELQPVFVNLPLPDSQVVPPEPPVVEGGGGDRGINLLRGPKPKRQRLAPASFAVSFFQDGQRFRARVDSESFFTFNGLSEAWFDFTAHLDASSEISYRSNQAQRFTAEVSASGQIRSFVPVKPSFTAARIRVEFGVSVNKMACKFEVET